MCIGEPVRLENVRGPRKKKVGACGGRALFFPFSRSPHCFILHSGILFLLMAHPLDPNDLVALEGGGRPDLIPRKMAYLTSQAGEFKIFKGLCEKPFQG